MYQFPIHTRYCPNYNQNFEVLMGLISDGSLSSGDMSVCFRCGIVLKFDMSLNIIPVSKEEIKSLKLNNEEAYCKVMYMKQKVLEKYN